MTAHGNIRFAYRTPPELSGRGAARYTVVIVGAGPVGLAAAIDLALQGVACVVLDDSDSMPKAWSTSS